MIRSKPVLRTLFALLVMALGLACAGGTPGPVAAPSGPTLEAAVLIDVDGDPESLEFMVFDPTSEDPPLGMDSMPLALSSPVPEVLERLQAGRYACELLPPPEPPAPVAAPGAPAVEPLPQPEPEADGKLKLAVNYNGGKKSMEVVNLATQDYTNVTMVINDEWQYRLKSLKRSAGDHVRFKSFVSRRTGAEGGKFEMKKITITADQGSYSRTF